jgi:hypothetical protein
MKFVPPPPPTFVKEEVCVGNAVRQAVTFSFFAHTFGFILLILMAITTTESML